MSQRVTDMKSKLVIYAALITASLVAQASAAIIDWDFDFTLSNGTTGSGIFVTTIRLLEVPIS